MSRPQQPTPRPRQPGLVALRLFGANAVRGRPVANDPKAPAAIALVGFGPWRRAAP
jgi:hypothetical protein